MEAVFGKASHRGFELAWTHWLVATRRLARAALAATFDFLVNTSRAGLMVRAGSRRRRRF